ncbi:MAG: SDR family NAD(P)-dependent oxidoreductase [Cyanobacteria bacterium P01_E01_bin.45]
MTEIAGKTILLTGASRGIGFEIARELARRGGTVIGVARSQQKLDTAREQILSEGGTFKGFSFDISQISGLASLIQSIEATVGQIDILINNAGIEIYGEFQNYSTEEIEQTIGINLIAPMELSRLLLSRMLSRDSGHIVNIASLASKKGHPYDSIYSASKGGLLLWGDSVRQEIAKTSVKISTVCPGYVSDRGMLADTGIPAPKLSGTSTATQVACATILAIESNQIEVIVNQDKLTEISSKFFFATWELFPRFGDLVYHWIGIAKTNYRRINRHSST